MIEDDDVDGEMLETYGGLLAFARAKLARSLARPSVISTWNIAGPDGTTSQELLVRFRSRNRTTRLLVCPAWVRRGQQAAALHRRGDAAAR